MRGTEGDIVRLVDLFCIHSAPSIALLYHSNLFNMLLMSLILARYNLRGCTLRYIVHNLDVDFNASGHINDAADTVASLRSVLVQIFRVENTQFAHMHVVESRVHLIQLTVMSDVLIDLQLASEIIYEKKKDGNKLKKTL